VKNSPQGRWGLTNMTSKKIDLAAASLEKTDAERVVPLAKSTLDFLTFAAIYAEHQLSEYRTPKAGRGF